MSDAENNQPDARAIFELAEAFGDAAEVLDEQQVATEAQNETSRPQY